MRHNPVALPILRCRVGRGPLAPRTTSQVLAITRTLSDASTRTVLALFVLTIACLISVTTQSFAQSPNTLIPDNAHAKSYGEGWECDSSFRILADQCAEIVLPENAYLTNRTYGAGWECLHGFKEVEGTSCDVVFVPTNGYLDQSGSRWGCLRGFRKSGDVCGPIAVPDHAYLADDAYGADWTCDRGYEKSLEECIVIVVPENAYLNAASYGLPWSCERGYIEQGNTCEAIVVPVNAYLDDPSYGPGWKCERGYFAKDSTCSAIVLPENAHLDRSGNRWECDRNFRNSKGKCALGE